MAKIMKDGKPSTSFSRQDREWVKSMRGGDTPTGTITITENGEYDVTNYATADVQVAGGSSDFFIATVEDNVLDKTWQEVSDALDDLGDGKVWIIGEYTADRVKACNPGKLLHESWTIDVYDSIGQTVAGEFYTEDGPNAYPVAD